ncbi:MAG: DOMON-like domain-containing protein [Nitrospirae bacterium]|nr:DOMON-like domain-containing protein [Nitrospirota bacterium]
MSIRDFSLRPFPADSPVPDIKITGSIDRNSNVLSVNFELLGPCAELIISPLSDKPTRTNGLWEETCFELFLGMKNSSAYWEFNLSPAGHWNVYRFNAYRQGMQEEPAITSLPFRTEHKSDSFRLSMEVDLNEIVPADQVLEAALSAVVKAINGKLSCWALVHPGTQADFHRRDGFIIAL